MKQLVKHEQSVFWYIVNCACAVDKKKHLSDKYYRNSKNESKRNVEEHKSIDLAYE